MYSRIGELQYREHGRDGNVRSAEAAIKDEAWGDDLTIGEVEGKALNTHTEQDDWDIK